VFYPSSIYYRNFVSVIYTTKYCIASGVNFVNYIVVLKLTGLYWKRKCRNLHKYVKKRRQMRSTKISQPTERAKNWQFIEIMNFLERYVQFRTEMIYDDQMKRKDAPKCHVLCLVHVLHKSQMIFLSTSTKGKC